MSPHAPAWRCQGGADRRRNAEAHGLVIGGDEQATGMVYPQVPTRHDLVLSRVRHHHGSCGEGVLQGLEKAGR